MNEEEFFQLFSECPECGRKNHKDIIKNHMQELDSKIIQDLVRIKFSQDKKHKMMKIGILCCDCFYSKMKGQSIHIELNNSEIITINPERVTEILKGVIDKMYIKELEILYDKTCQNDKLMMFFHKLYLMSVFE